MEKMEKFISFKDQSPWVLNETGIIDAVQKYSFQKRTYGKGSYIYQQDEEIHYLHMLVEGRIKVGLISHDGQEKTLAIHEAGSFFGETAFFDNKPSFTFALAMNDSLVLALGKKEVMDLFSGNSNIPFHLLASIGRKMRLLTFQLEYLSFMSIEKRIIAYLLCLFDTMGSRCPECDKLKGKKCSNGLECINGNRLNITITDQELGNMLGVRREGVTKAISKLKRANLLYKKQRTLCIPDMDKIYRYLFSGEEV